MEYAIPRRPLLPGFKPLGGGSRRYAVVDQAGVVVDTISRRQYDRLSIATHEGDTRTQYGRMSARAKQAGYRNYSDYRQQSKQWGPQADKWTMRMYEAGVPESKLGPLSRNRHNAILVAQARAAHVDILGNRLPDSTDPSGILSDPEGPLAQILVEMGWREQDETQPPGSS